ncbi:Hypothetical predicted protein, partial [Paramuricea clavata]
MQCMLQDKSCRSANFRKTSGEQENCELLRTVYSEEQPVNLKKNENFDYYILLQPDRKPEDAVSLSTPRQITKKVSTTTTTQTNGSTTQSQTKTKSTLEKTDGPTNTTTTNKPRKRDGYTTQTT